MQSNLSHPYVKNQDYPADWKLYMTEANIQKNVSLCADMINEKFKNVNIILVCILKGATWFFADLTKKLTIPYTTYFVEASSYKNNQKQDESVEIISQINPEKFKNKVPILIDELYDNGTTMEHLKKAISDIGNVPYDLIQTMALFKKNKPESFSYPGTLDMFGVCVHNVWLVGYGLDDKQEKRGWIHLFAVPKPPEMEKSEDDILIFESD